MLYLIVKIIITSVVVVLIGEIAKRSNIFAGLIASLPLTSFLAFIWIYWETRESQKIIDLSYSIILMIIPSITFFIILPFLLKLNNSFIFSMISATLSTAIFYWIFFLILDKFGIN